MGLILEPSTDKIQVITGSALATCYIHASWMNIDGSAVVTPGSSNFAISTATTTDVITAPSASNYRIMEGVTVYNNNASAQTITIQHTDGTNAVPIWTGVLALGEKVIINKELICTKYDREGRVAGASIISNQSVTSQGAGFATDTYVTGSSILIPLQRPRIGTVYECEMGVTKTNAGTATPIIQLRYGTNGTTADTSLCSFTFSAGTAATDSAIFKVRGLYRSVGSGSTAVIAGRCSLVAQPTTGFSSLIKSVTTISAGHNSETASTILGVSVNGGTSASWTIDYVKTRLIDI
jgi:hypothetical protein